MWKYFSSQNHYRWIDVLDKIILNYNNSYHTAIKMKPVDVAKQNESEVWNNLYGKVEASSRPKFVASDTVRITKYKRKLFDKGYVPNWTEEIF